MVDLLAEWRQNPILFLERGNLPEKHADFNRMQSFHFKSKIGGSARFKKTRSGRSEKTRDCLKIVGNTTKWFVSQTGNIEKLEKLRCRDILHYPAISDSEHLLID